jgi:hypothetical protein
MTEAEWLACTDPEPMLEFLRGKASERKLRLFACACVRTVWHLLDARSRNLVDLSERFADGVATRQQVASARKQQKADYRNRYRADIAKAVSEQSAFGWAFGWDIAHYTLRAKSSDAARLAVRGFAVACRTGLLSDGSQGYRPVASLHDLFGNPFRPSAPLTPAVLNWNDATVPRIAQSIYDARRLPAGTLDTGHLAILADALLDAGCDDEELIQHCRSAGPHVRGCWAVDAILGKS